MSDYTALLTRRPLTHPVVSLFAHQRGETLATMLRLPDHALVLDVGAGPGVSSSRWRRVIALDLDADLLARNPARWRIRGDGMTLPLADQSVDLVTSWEVLHHITDPEVALREAWRVSRGYVVAFEPNPWNPLIVIAAFWAPDHRQVLRTPMGAWKAMMRRAGLDVVMAFHGGWVSENWPTCLLPLVRWLPYRSGAFSSVVVGERPAEIRAPAATRSRSTPD